MRKFTMFIFTVALITLMVSCATVNPRQTGSETVEGSNLDWTNLPKQPSFERTTDYKKFMKVVGKDGIPRPEWVVATPVDNNYYYAVGMSDLSNPVDALKLATIESKNIISEWVNTTVREQISAYKSIVGKSSDPTTARAAEILTIQVSESVLAGCKQEDVWVSKDGVTYVLTSIPIASVAGQMNSKIKTSLELNVPDETKDVSAADALDALHTVKENANLK